ncbi:MAG: aromatic ring-hydroxylating dioxygenase subunit alpha [Caulobacterales bacterium]
MNKVSAVPPALDGSNPANVRGDRMNGERYYSPEFAQREWEHMWKRVWHVAGRENELQEPGDYIVHDFLHESVIVTRQDDGSLKAFFNSCGHRGHRLATQSASTNGFQCPYHGWLWGKDGVLADLPDAENFPQGNPCGKLKLREVRCGVWAGFVWYTMSDEAPELLDFLSPIPELYKNFQLDKAIRVFQMQIELETNWKFAPENFSESYHTRTAHPQVPFFCDQDYWNARLEMFPNGHGRTVQPMRPSLRDRGQEGAPHPYDYLLKRWDIDPSIYPDLETKSAQGWLDLKAQKRKLWKERGFLHYEHLNDEQLTDSLHTTLFPNVTLTYGPDEIYFQRTEPHPTDPNKCTFDLWCLAFPVKGATHTENPMVGTSVLELKEAPPIRRSFDGGRGVPEMHGGVVIQDLQLAEAQQKGIRSMGYQDAYLAAAETRVRFFNEVLNDYLEGRR